MPSKRSKSCMLIFWSMEEHKKKAKVQNEGSRYRLFHNVLPTAMRTRILTWVRRQAQICLRSKNSFNSLSVMCWGRLPTNSCWLSEYLDPPPTLLERRPLMLSASPSLSTRLALFLSRSATLSLGGLEMRHSPSNKRKQCQWNLVLYTVLMFVLAVQNLQSSGLMESFVWIHNLQNRPVYYYY